MMGAGIDLCTFVCSSCYICSEHTKKCLWALSHLSFKDGSLEDQFVTLKAVQGFGRSAYVTSSLLAIDRCGCVL